MLTAEQRAERRDVIKSCRTIKEAAEIIRISATRLAKWARENNVHPSKSESEKSAERSRMYRLGMTDREIADATGSNYETIRAWRTNRGWPLNSKPKVVPVAKDTVKITTKREMVEPMRGFFQMLLNAKHRYPMEKIDVLEAAKIYREGLM